VGAQPKVHTAQMKDVAFEPCAAARSSVACTSPTSTTNTPDATTVH
jgi:hypothetical protein